MIRLSQLTSNAASSATPPQVGTDEFGGLWRGSAMEKVPYTDDFPEPLLVLPELYDGAIGQGKATEIITSFVERAAGEWFVLVKDNGNGIRNIPRLLRWAAPTSLDNYHRNGHGLKKALTKFAPDYASADWTIQWRNPGQFLQTIRAPFLGIDTPIDTDEDNQDTTTLMPSGTRISIRTDLSLFGAYASPSELLRGVKEIIKTRMSETVLRRVRFRVTIKPLNEPLQTEDSDEWHSFKWWVQRCVQGGTVEMIRENEAHDSGGAPWLLSWYRIVENGAKNYDLKREFPIYGAKNQRGQRVMIALQDRIIEYAPYHKFVGKPVSHNSDNGIIVIVEFMSPDLARKPEPSTTKVSMYEHGDIYKAFVRDLRAILSGPVPVPVPIPGPFPIVPPVIPDDAPQTRQTKIDKLEDALGVKFKFSGDSILVQFPSTNNPVWLSVTDFQFAPRI
jgi:hypothetical protein